MTKDKDKGKGKGNDPKSSPKEPVCSQGDIGSQTPDNHPASGKQTYDQPLKEPVCSKGVIGSQTPDNHLASGKRTYDQRGSGKSSPSNSSQLASATKQSLASATKQSLASATKQSTSTGVMDKVEAEKRKTHSNAKVAGTGHQERSERSSKKKT